MGGCALADWMDSYLSAVRDQVRWKRARAGLESELRAHLLDQAEACQAQGMDQAEAQAESLRQMGDPVEVGTQLDRVHRPKPQWGLLLLVGAVLAVGFQLQSLTYELAGAEALLTQSAYYQIRWTLSACAGVAVLAAVYLLDYTVLSRRPLAWCCAGFLLLLVRLTTSRHVSGRLIDAVPWTVLSPVLLAVLVYGMRGRGWRGYLACLGGTAACTAVTLLIPSAACGALTAGAGLFLTLLPLRRGWLGVSREKRAWTAVLSFLPPALLVLRYAPSLARRLPVLLHPELDPLGSGYCGTVVRSLIRGAKWIGQGSCGLFTAYPDLEADTVAKLLPGAVSDYFLTWTIHKLGWLAALAVVGLLVLLLARMTGKVRRQRSMLGCLVSAGAVFALWAQLVFYVLANLGFPLFSPLTLPLISYGGRHSIVNMILIGLALSVFREEQLPFTEQKTGNRTQSPGAPLLVWRDGDLVIRLSQWKKAKQ